MSAEDAELAEWRLVFVFFGVFILAKIQEISLRDSGGASITNG